MKLKNKQNNGLLNLPTRLLGVFAHPDDEMAGVGGTLIKNVELGGTSLVVCFGGSSKKRFIEFENACKKAKLDYLALRKKEWAYSDDKGLVVKNLKKLIIDFQPEFILTHRSENDYHYDHRVVYDLVKDAATMAQTPLVNSLIKGLLLTENHFLHSKVHVFVDITSTYNLLVDSFKLHESQIVKNDGYYLNILDHRTKLRGFQAGCNRAEAFQFEPLQLIGSFNRRNLGV